MRRVAWVFAAVSGEWGADVPACPQCDARVREQHSERFVILLFCVAAGAVAAAIVVPDDLGWWRQPAMVAVLLFCTLPYWVFEWCNRRPVSLTVNDTEATFCFRNPEYAAEVRSLNSVPRGFDVTEPDSTT